MERHGESQKEKAGIISYVRKTAEHIVELHRTQAGLGHSERTQLASSDVALALGPAPVLGPEHVQHELGLGLEPGPEPALGHEKNTWSAQTAEVAVELAPGKDSYTSAEPLPQ